MVGWVGKGGRNSTNSQGSGCPAGGKWPWVVLLRALWWSPALGHHVGLGAWCSRRHGGGDATISKPLASREHVAMAQRTSRRSMKNEEEPAYINRFAGARRCRGLNQVPLLSDVDTAVSAAPHVSRPRSTPLTAE